MSNRKNSFEKKEKKEQESKKGSDTINDIKDSRTWSIGSMDTRNDSKDSRTWSIGSIGSMDTIILDEEDMVNKNTKPRRRSRDKTIDIRRDSPSPHYWKSLLAEILKIQNQNTKTHK